MAGSRGSWDREGEEGGEAMGCQWGLSKEVEGDWGNPSSFLEEALVFNIFLFPLT